MTMAKKSTKKPQAALLGHAPGMIIYDEQITKENSPKQANG
jgi:hypothetical protein